MHESRRKRFQFSLFALLAFTFVAACGLYANYVRERTLLETIHNDSVALKELEAKQLDVSEAQHCPECTALGLEIENSDATYKPANGDKEYPAIMLRGGGDVILIHDKLALIGPKQKLDALARRPDDVEKAYAECVERNKIQNEISNKYNKAWDEICTLSRKPFYFFRAPDPNEVIKSTIARR